MIGLEYVAVGLAGLYELHFAYQLDGTRDVPGVEVEDVVVVPEASPLSTPLSDGRPTL